MRPLLLPPGPDEIDLYSDGSHRHELQIGGWACCVPAFGLEMAAAGVGSSVEWFELAGVVAGIEGVAAVEHSVRPIHVHTDSAFVVCLFKHLVAGPPNRSRPTFVRVEDLIRRVAGSCAQRNLKCSYTHGKHPAIRRCHLAAARKVRNYVATDPILSHQLALRREKNKLSTLSAERDKLNRRLQIVDAKLRLCVERVSALAATVPLGAAEAELGNHVRDLLGDPSFKPQEAARPETVLITPKQNFGCSPFDP